MVFWKESREKIGTLIKLKELIFTDLFLGKENRTRICTD
jgi:hypothetical protein